MSNQHKFIRFSDTGNGSGSKSPKGRMQLLVVNQRKWKLILLLQLSLQSGNCCLSAEKQRPTWLLCLEMALPNVPVPMY